MLKSTGLPTSDENVQPGSDVVGPNGSCQSVWHRERIPQHSLLPIGIGNRHAPPPPAIPVVSIFAVALSPTSIWLPGTSSPRFSSPWPLHQVFTTQGEVEHAGAMNGDDAVNTGVGALIWRDTTQNQREGLVTAGQRTAALRAPCIRR